MNNILPKTDYPKLRFYKQRQYLEHGRQVYKIRPVGFGDAIGHLVGNPHTNPALNILYLKTHCCEIGFGSVALMNVRGKEDAKNLLSGLTKSTWEGSDIQTALEAAVGNKWDQLYGEEEEYVPFIKKQNDTLYRGYFGRVPRDYFHLQDAIKPIGHIYRNRRRRVEGNGKKKWKSYYKAVVFADWGSLNPILICDGVSLKEARSTVKHLLKDRKTFVETISTRLAEDIASFRYKCPVDYERVVGE